MSDHLFRFRSIDSLLDGFHELENSEIYFSPPEQLNDPLEGFKDVFWCGDEVVWTNLLRHYLLCLMQAMTITVISGETLTADMCSTLIHQTADDLPIAPVRQTYAAICDDFLALDATKTLVASLSTSATTLRRDGLIFHLRLLHGLAMGAVFTAFDRRGLSLLQPTEGLKETLGHITEAMEKSLHAHSQAPSEFSEVIYGVAETLMSQLHLIHGYNNDVTNDKKSWLFVARDFPEFYVNTLERLIHPDWHTASFVANPANAAMWGAYGDGHRGICLKFQTRPDAEGRPTLDLYRANSWSGGKDREMVAHYSYVPHGFEKVTYTADFPEIDFFQSLGTVSIRLLKKAEFAAAVCAVSGFSRASEGAGSR